MGVISCGELHEVAAELALGVLPGAERADALAHVASCAPCRVLVDDLAQVSDSLMLVAPEVEPPIGFESKVLDRAVDRTAAPARHRWRLGAALLAAAAAVTGVGLGVGSLTAQRSQAPATAAAPGEGPVREAAFKTSSARPAGQVVAYTGRPSWVFVTVRDVPATGWLACEVTTTSGRSYRLGTFHIYEGHGSWGASVPVPPDQLRSARLVGADGATVATATF